MKQGFESLRAEAAPVLAELYGEAHVEVLPEGGDPRQPLALSAGAVGSPTGFAWDVNADGNFGDATGPLKDVERFDVEGGYMFMIQDKLLFESGKAELGAEGRVALLELVAEIDATPWWCPCAM